MVGEIHGREAGQPDDLIERLGLSMTVETISSEPGRSTFVARRGGG
jgi:hypothetical protein